MHRRRISLVLAAATFGLSALGAHAQDIQARTIRWGHLNQTDHPISAGVRKFAEIVQARSGGKLVVKEFPNSQLGSELQQQAALRGGTQEMFSSSTSSLTGIVKEFGLLDFPFIVASPEQSDKLVDGPFGDLLRAKLAGKGLVAPVFWDLGFRHTTNTRHAVQTLDDFKGLKLRVIPNPVYVETFKALGVNAVPMAFGEVYGALESRAIDGQENPLSVILSSKLYEVQKFLTASNHAYTTPIVLIGKKFWDRLSPAEQKILHEAALESRAYQRQASRDYNAKAVAELQAKGMQYNELSAAERDKLRRAVEPVVAKFSAEYDPAALKLFRSELARIQAAQ
jgi:tripartite ATP-independent transporter DctP family solute receptor